jgi:nicotinate phosphoribosyltransferase
MGVSLPQRRGPAPYLGEIRNQLELLSELTLDGQLAFLERISFLKPDFLRFLRLFRFNLRYVRFGIENDQLFLRLRGPWLHVILFEVPLLAIISEVRNRHLHPHMRLAEARDQLYRKFDWLRAMPATTNWPNCRWPTSAPVGAFQPRAGRSGRAAR